MLTQLECYVNQIKGESMEALVESLPKVSKGIMMVIYNANEQNVMTFTQVKAAKAKGWIPYYYPSNNWLKYDGIPITIDATNFPDEKFRNYLLSQNYGADGKLIATEIAEVSKIDVSSQEIQSLQGIEFFTALTELDCSRNQLASLDLSECTELRTLNCYYNQLTSLGISKNTALTELRCFSNQLTSLDVSNNTKLTRLWCGGNQLTSLDVFKNTAVTSLSCSSNQLTSLDVSNNTKLTELNCGHNQLTSLDVSKNTKLTELTCDPGVNVIGWPK
jgi:Leucine-rich repeat (LRR) protein